MHRETKPIEGQPPSPEGSGRDATLNSDCIPPITVGVMGCAGESPSGEAFRKIHQLGQEVARRGYVLVTGACPGLPQEAIKGAKSEGSITIGISPALNFREHMMKYKSPCRGFDALIYTGSGLMGREIENIRSCDLVIFAGGRSGSLGEFAIAYDESKVIYDEDPVRLLDRLVEIYDNQILPYYRSVLANRNPDGQMED